MPEAVVFYNHYTIHTVYFNQAHAMLPVKLKQGGIQLITWGRREHENSEMPLGGWARLLNLRTHDYQHWHMYTLKSVQIPVIKFMEKNFEGKPCWYEVTKGKCLQGVLAKWHEELRLYIVTIDPEDLMNCHYRWPHIMANTIAKM